MDKLPTGMDTMLVHKTHSQIGVLWSILGASSYLFKTNYRYGGVQAETISTTLSPVLRKRCGRLLSNK